MEPDLIDNKDTVVSTALSNATESIIVTVESRIVKGFSGLKLIGNTTEVCRNGTERARAALESLGYPFPQKKTVVSISPAELKKDGSQYDLPFAVSLALLIARQTPWQDCQRWMFAAELSLRGDLMPVKSIVSFALQAAAKGLEGVVISKRNLADVEVLTSLDLPEMEGFKILSFDNLREVLNWVFMNQMEETPIIQRTLALSGAHMPDFDDMILSDDMKTAIEAVCVGGHSLLMTGVPGTGKSMLANRLTSVMPLMEPSDHLDALKIMSSHSETLSNSLVAGRPPYRAPHHLASAASILGSTETPGEVSLSHGGVLFLDELPEFRRDIIEGLREPLESGEIRVSRAKEKVTWKGRFALVAAANPCPCGWAGSKYKDCDCGTLKIANYQRKMSGPILDRIDIQLHMNENHKERRSSLFFPTRAPGESQSSEMRTRVLKGREFARSRNSEFGIKLNRDLSAQQIRQASGLENEDFATLVDQNAPKSLSNRSLVRALRVARTLADIDGSVKIRNFDVKRALGWRTAISRINGT